MSYSRMVLPSRDPACGRVFHADRREAEAHRIALEVWYRAVGRVVPGRRLVVYHCKRCAGHHVAFRRIRTAPAPIVPASTISEREQWAAWLQAGASL